VHLLQELQLPKESAAHAAGLPVDRELVDRIVFSAGFIRSPRLSDFLLYVCKESEEGRQSEISEHNIGVAVFGRSEDYDSTIDSIVRSHATRLRQRLRDYFSAEGLHERNLLTIPKGSYVPRFEPREAYAFEEESIPSAEKLGSLIFERAVEEQAFLEDSVHKKTVEASAPNDATKRTIRRLKLFVIALLTASAALAFLLWHLIAISPPRNTHPLWSSFFNSSHGRTLIVESDSGLVMLQHLTGRPVSLDAYMSGKYLGEISNSAASAELTVKFGSKRYTPVVDTEICNHIFNLLSGQTDRISLRFARDLRIDELKQGNALLMGSPESNPWVSLFEPSMNFHFRGNLSSGFATIVNQNPRPGEQREYEMLEHDAEQTVYGHIAYRPNLDHVGHVLILEGLTVAGTETAADFLFNEDRLKPFLKSIEQKDGHIPHFEVVLRSSSLSGQSSQTEIVAYRVEND
jgi:hypothetical protein